MVYFARASLGDTAGDTLGDTLGDTVGRLRSVHLDLDLAV